MSLYAHILKHIKKDRPGLPPEGLMLPGAESWSGSSPFVAGSADHLAIHSGGTKVPEKVADAAIASIVEAAREILSTREPSEELIQRMENALEREEPLAVVDVAIERVLALDVPDWEPLYLAIFTIDAGTGRLTAAGHQTGIKTPRNFGIDPTGAYLLAAHQAGDKVQAFRVDPATGRLTAAGEPVEIPAPVCVKFVPRAK